MLVCHLCGFPGRSEVGVGCPGTRAAGRWEPPDVGAGNCAQTLQKSSK